MWCTQVKVVGLWTTLSNNLHHRTIPEPDETYGSLGVTHPDYQATLRMHLEQVGASGDGGCVCGCGEA